MLTSDTGWTPSSFFLIVALRTRTTSTDSVLSCGLKANMKALGMKVDQSGSPTLKKHCVHIGKLWITGAHPGAADVYTSGTAEAPAREGLARRDPGRPGGAGLVRTDPQS